MTPPSELQKELIIKEYAEQQIYLEPDIIIDRTNQVKIHAEGSGKVIKKMINIFSNHASKYKFKDKQQPYVSFIKELAEELAFEEQNGIDHFLSRYNEMRKGEVFDHSIYFMTCIGSVVETFQTKIVKRLSLRLKRKIPHKKESEILQNLESLSQTSNSTFSLLINIEILKEMSRLFGTSMKPIMTDSLEKKLVSLLT